MEAKTINKYGSVSTNKLIKKAEKVFNEFIRLRDSDENGNFKCISCGYSRDRYSLHAGHYFSKQNSSLRFDERNVNGECENCNCHDSKHLEKYLPNLIRKIGTAQFCILEELAQSGKQNFKWDRFELINIIETYSQKAKQLKKSKNY